MSIRQIILDTETTGLQVTEGHRLIEIGCLELIERKLTGKQFHYYLNPERDVEAGALAVHGITNAFLQDKPVFKTIADEFMLFIADAELIIHNAPFDLSFLDDELRRVNPNFSSLREHCRILDTLLLARQIHMGQKNSLDALCKRYGIDLSKRELHGALLDAHLLTQVYLAMTGGQSSLFDSVATTEEKNEIPTETQLAQMNLQKTKLLKANDEELREHASYLEYLQKQGQCCWLEEEGLV